VTGRNIYRQKYANFATLASDESRFIVSDASSKSLHVHDMKSGERLQTLKGDWCFYNSSTFLPDCERFIAQNWESNAIHLWRRYRPEYWYGLAWLPEFWITITLVGTLILNLRRDWCELWN
jgi:hypothetical protein